MKHDAFGETHFIWDGNRLLSETRHSHNCTYLYAGNSFVPLAQVDHVAGETEEKPAKLLYFHTDHLGTPRELTDSTGNLQWAATYKAWGNVLQVEQVGFEANSQAHSLQQLQALRFQGQYFDIETGLHYNRFRYYDPDIGRFVSQDPIGLAGGNNCISMRRIRVGGLILWGWKESLLVFKVLGSSTNLDKLHKRA